MTPRHNLGCRIQPEPESEKVKGFSIETARQVGVLLAQKAKEKGIVAVVFRPGGLPVSW